MPTEVLSPTANGHDAHERNNNTDFQAGLTVIATVSTAVANDCYSAGVYLANTIPQYAEIVSAALEVWPLVNDDAVFLVFGNAALGVDFATNADITVRTLTRTLAEQYVSQADLGVGAYRSITPDMAHIVQELVNSREWVDDTPIVLLLAGTPAAGTGTLYISAYETSPSQVLKFTVEWQTPPDLGIQLEELIHTMPTRALGVAIGAGDIMSAGDPSIFIDPDTGIKQMAFAGNRAGVTGIDMFIVPFDSAEDDWDINRSALLANVSDTPIVSRVGGQWDEHRIESPSYVEGYDATNEVNVRRIYYAGGNDAGSEGPFEIGFLQDNEGTWERHGDPVITATESWEDWEGGVSYVLEPSVIYDAEYDPPWRMLYTAGDELNLAYADSQDGITWGNKTIFFASEGFPAWSVDWAKVGNHYELVTSSISKPGVLSRSWCETPSSTFADWSAFETLLEGGEGQKWHENWIYGPAIHTGDNGAVWVYFTGRDDVYEATRPHIGRLMVEPLVDDTTLDDTSSWMRIRQRRLMGGKRN